MRDSDWILVTGGHGGIGAAVAAQYAPRAVVWSRRGVGGGVGGGGSSGVVGAVDVTDGDAVARAAQAELAARGAPFGLVHAVGDFDERPLLATDAAAYRHLLDSNLTSAFLVVREVVPAMTAAGRGRVVLFGSAGVEDQRAKTRAPVYFAAKAALVSLARSLAKEVAAAGVTVNVISPGLIAHEGSHHESQRRMAARVPLGRTGTPADVLPLVQLLLGDGGAYVTGANLTVDGGLSL